MEPYDFRAELMALVPNLRGFARSLCGNADWTDDLVQETIMRAWANQKSFEPGTNMKAWLFTILRNYFFNELRKKKRVVEMQRENGALETGMHETQSSSLHLNDLVRELDRLRPDQREALILTAVDGFSYEEAAEISGCAVGTIKSRVARARRELEERLGGPEIGRAADGALSSAGPDGSLIVNSR